MIHTKIVTCMSNNTVNSQYDFHLTCARCCILCHTLGLSCELNSAKISVLEIRQLKHLKEAFVLWV